MTDTLFGILHLFSILYLLIYCLYFLKKQISMVFHLASWYMDTSVYTVANKKGFFLNPA